MQQQESLIPKHGGYRNLKTFQVGQLIYDMTVRFVDQYIDKFSRTRDQMEQAARSGVQNIAEGSAASATSKKTELKLTNVARSSQEELRLDYEAFLRQRNLPQLEADDPILKRFKARRCKTLTEVKAWISEERNRADNHGPARTDTDRHMRQLSSAALAANATLSLINLCTHLLDKQIEAQAKAFENEGGFTERMYRIRSQKRKRQ
jgi:four helix bundle suffix protein